MEDRLSVRIKYQEKLDWLRSFVVELFLQLIFLFFFFFSLHKLSQIATMFRDTIRNDLNEFMKKYDEYSERYFALLPVLGKKAVLVWCMKEGLIGSSNVCPKCGKSMELRERTG
ncbi:hypothetical protein TNCV_183791 [Trichonephila clavipes]|nr:hypothetical protein TNCV_183791 [Trichonephila clavipes]